MGRGLIAVAWLAPAAFLSTGLASADPAAPAAPAAAVAPAPPAYPLDQIPRRIPSTGAVACPKVELVDYQGTVVRWQFPGKVVPALRERLATFEGVARDVGVEIYGRPPSRVVQLGTYNCRRMRDASGWLSEHALGNAVDVEGFDFGPLPRGAKLPDGLPRAFASAFETRVGRHWAKHTGHAAVHARFLETLIIRLIERERAHGDAFHVLLGPGYPGHDRHFHFDMAPFHMVQISVEGVPIEGRPHPAPAGASSAAPTPSSGS